MYGKIFEQIYDSSIAEDFHVRLVFQDMIILADINGVVDMTHEALSRRTNVPIEIVRRAIDALEKADPKSRTPDNQGVRIVRLDDHRDWGWMIVNHERFRQIASDEQRRATTRDRVSRFRKNHKHLEARNGTVTHSNAGNAMQRQRQKQRHSTTKLPTKATKALSGAQKELADDFEKALAEEWVNDAGKWIGRIRSNFGKTRRICDELVDAIKGNRITTTPARYAEHLEVQFK